GEGLAFDQLHHQVVSVALAADIVQGADVRVTEAGDGAGLALESGPRSGVRAHVPGQHLDRHVPPEPGIPRAVHLAHAARTKQSGDLERPELRARGERHPAGNLYDSGLWNRSLGRNVVDA